MFAMDMEEDDVDDAAIQLDSVIQAKGDRLTYEYDFGDGWEHEIVVLEIGPPKAKGFYPAVIDGARNCPPEDAGGAHGYQACVDGDLDWMDDNYDPTKFDAKLAQKRVAKVKLR